MKIILAFIRFLFGYCVIEIRTDSEQFISYLMREHISFWRIEKLEGSVYTLCIYSKNRRMIKKASVRFDCAVKETHGLSREIAMRVSRPGLLIGTVICVMVTCISTLFVWNINIAGNELYTSEQIISMLNNDGFKVGSFIPSLDIKRLNNLLILHNSENIAWFSININGTIANVEVRERRLPPTVFDASLPINIIASKSGQIVYADVYQGQGVIAVGDTVQRGQLLISALIDSKTVGIRVGHASGLIEAVTTQDITVEIPLKKWVKKYTGEEDLKFSVKILEKTGNFNYNSSISMAKYDKIVLSEKVTLYDRISLPIYIVRTRYKEYEWREIEVSLEQAKSAALDKLHEITAKMTGAQIVSQAISYTQEHDALILRCELVCIEDIAVEQEIKVNLR